jgi:soluble lytic murein transglycosylase-like protein
MYFLALLFLGMVSSAWAGEYAVLANGARLHVDHHSIQGAKIRLYNGDGFIEMNAALVVSFEDDGDPAAATALPQQAAAAPATPRQLADAAADKYGLPRQLVRSVMSAESGFQTGAVSPKGAIGLMQLMPSTALTLGVNPRDPAQNADAGARYLRALLEKYHGALYHALAAYNAGPETVDKYRGVPPFPETLHYVSRIASEWKKANSAPDPEPHPRHSSGF